jgi:hypothetical protein
VNAKYGQSNETLQTAYVKSRVIQAAVTFMLLYLETSLPTPKKREKRHLLSFGNLKTLKILKTHQYARIKTIYTKLTLPSPVKPGQSREQTNVKYSCL